jgi:hypothetical protein
VLKGNDQNPPNCNIHDRDRNVRFTPTPAARLTSIREVQSLSTNVRRIRRTAAEHRMQVTAGEEGATSTFVVSADNCMFPGREHHGSHHLLTWILCIYLHTSRVAQPLVKLLLLRSSSAKA